MLILLTFGAGCGQGVSTVKTTQEPYKAKSLTVCCYPSVDPRPIRQFAEEWSLLKGADIHVSTECMPPAVPDVVIVSSADLPGLVETGRFLPVAPAILDREHFYQWEGLLHNYSGLLAVWNGVAYGVPLLGEGYVMVYRKDRFAEANLKPPENWEDFVNAAKQLTISGRPSLPALPSSPLGLETEFHLIASCFDRSTLQQGEIGNQIPDEAKADRLYSYHYRLKTGEPRINAPPFVEAFELMRRMRPYRAPAKPDPLTDLLDGNASLAIVDLKDLARLQHDPASKIRGKLGIAKLPGAGFTFDLDDGKKAPTRAPDVNRTPYLGYGSWIGLVSKTCAHPDMAFEFLAGFADPERTGAEIITSANWGAGPLRSAQIEERARSLWFGYDLTAPDTEAMISALKQSIASSVVNTRYRLRLPNRQEHLKKFDRIVRDALLENADGQKTLNDVAEAWKQLWNGVPDETKKAWIKHIYGL